MKRAIALAVVLTAGCAAGPKPDVDRQKLAEINAELGLRYMMQGQLELSMQKLDKALEFDDESSVAHHYLAELYRRLGEWEDADEHFREALDLTPDDPNLLNNYGVFLCSRGRADQASRYFQRVLENPVYSGRAGTFENYGVCRLEQGDEKAAETNFRKALDLNPRMPKSLLEMAGLMWRQGIPLSARAYLQRYEEVAQHTPRSLLLGVRIERALGDRDAEASYGLLLTRKFPESREAVEYLRAERDS